ncbi:MAG: dTDP-4-dehydrorhamnose reductase family protein [Solirubrobacterales bacterium]
MRLLILGGTGMLGHKLWQRASGSLEAWATVRSAELDGGAAEVLDPGRVLTGVSADRPETVARAIDESGADVVVNCIGVVKQADAASDPVVSIRINSLFPHQVAALCRERGKRFIQISTDCVFSGAKGSYGEDDVADAGDLYGRSKLLGEAVGPGSLTVRTSIIGRELASSYGLVEWFLGEAAAGNAVRGFSRAIFSGFTTQALSEVLLELIAEQPELEGRWHVSAEPIDKDRLLKMLRDGYGLEAEITADDSVVIDRSLDSSRFRAATGWQPPPWSEMIEQLVADPTPYDEIRRSTLAQR